MRDRIYRVLALKIFRINSVIWSKHVMQHTKINANVTANVTANVCEKRGAKSCEMLLNIVYNLLGFLYICHIQDGFRLMLFSGRSLPNPQLQV